MRVKLECPKTLQMVHGSQWTQEGTVKANQSKVQKKTW